MKKARSLAFILAIVMIVALTGCGSQAAAPAATAAPAAAQASVDAAPAAEETHEPVTITFYHGTADDGAAVNAANAFMEMYPWITVEAIEFPVNTTEKLQILNTVFSAQDSSIDVFYCDCTWPAQFTGSDWLEDLSDVYTDEEMQDFIPGVVPTGLGKDGKLYALPLYVNVGAMLYRTDLLEKYGFDGPAATYEEMIAQCEVIVAGEKAEGNNIAGYTSAWTEYEGFSCQAFNFMWSYGAEFEQDGKCTLNSAEAIKGLSVMRELVEKGLTDTGIRGYKWVDSQAIFNNGGAVYMIDWPAAYNSATNPENSSVFDKVAMTHVPGGKDAESCYSTNGGWYVAVSAFSEHKEEAKLFAKYLTSYENEVQYCLTHGYLPTRLSCYENEQIIAERSTIASMIDAAAMCKSRPANPYYGEISTHIYGNVAKIVDGTVTPEEGAQMMAAEIQEILDR